MDNSTFRFRLSLALLVTVSAASIAGFMAAEGLAFADAVYFCIVTLTTVGYGDIHPASPTGKLIAAGLMVTGVGTFMGVVSAATDTLLNRRDKKLRHSRLNILVGTFFSEIGTSLLRHCVAMDHHSAPLRAELLVDQTWQAQDFQIAKARLAAYDFALTPEASSLEQTRRVLLEHTGFLLRLLENPNLIEHEQLTDLVWAVFHLKDELAHREELAGAPATDLNHLAGDLQRVYRQLAAQWIDYMAHLQQEYPYLFSLAVRLNPFDPRAQADVTQA